MSIAALELKRQQMEDYFTYHPDSQDIGIVGTEVTFPGLFDYAYKSDNKDRGNVNQQKKEPHITFYSGNASLLTAGTSQVNINGIVKKVYQLRYDATDGTYQAEAWLI